MVHIVFIIHLVWYQNYLQTKSGENYIFFKKKLKNLNVNKYLWLRSTNLLRNDGFQYICYLVSMILHNKPFENKYMKKTIYDQKHLKNSKININIYARLASPHSPRGWLAASTPGAQEFQLLWKEKVLKTKASLC